LVRAWEIPQAREQVSEKPRVRVQVLEMSLARGLGQEKPYALVKVF
jgi:hypothetical protein